MEQVDEERVPPEDGEGRPVGRPIRVDRAPVSPSVRGIPEEQAHENHAESEQERLIIRHVKALGLDA